MHVPSYSQSSSSGNIKEAGITVGPMVFLGDLGGHFGKGTGFLKDYNMATTKLAVGAYYTTYPAEWLGFRFEFSYGSVAGDDALIKAKGGSEEARLARNLDFRSKIVEGMVMAEIYPTVLLEDEPSDVTGRIRPYGAIGLGVFHFNPQGTYKDPVTGEVSWVDLRPLHTEGQGFIPGRPMYSLTQLNIPMAVGIKYYFSENVNISFEILYRKTFTDYMDDVSTKFVDPSVFYANLPPAMAKIADYMSNKSTLRNNIPGKSFGPGSKRGDPLQKDAYFTAGFKIGFRLGNNNQWRNSTHCPLLRF
jgi:hypothetical protein